MNSEMLHFLLLPCVVIGLTVFGLSCLRLYRFSNFTVDDASFYCIKINYSKGRNLLHPDQDAHLVSTLSPHRFKLFQRKRIGQSIEFLGRLTRNARFLRYMGWDELHRSLQRRDRKSRMTSQKLLVAAISCQALGFALLVKLHLWMLRMALLPFITPPNFADLVRSGNLMYLYWRAKKSALALARNYGDDVYARLAEVL